MDKQLLAKLYTDAYVHEDAEKTKRYGLQILDMVDFGEVYVESENLTVSHQLVWYHRLCDEKKSFPIETYISKRTVKRQRKIWAENVLLDRIARAEQAFENCSNLEGYQPQKVLGDIYSAMGYYYLPTDEGKEGVRRLIDRAKQHGLDSDALFGLLSCPAVPEDMLAELEVAELKTKKQLAIAKMLMPVAFQLERGSRNLQTITAEPLTEDYLKEVFKAEVEVNGSVPDEAKQAITDGSVVFKSQLVYAPSRYTEWTSTPAVYNWEYSPSQGYLYWGTFTYGGRSCSEIKSATSKQLVNDFIIDAAKSGHGHYSTVTAKDNFMTAMPIATVPTEILVTERDAREAFKRSKKVEDNWICEFSCKVKENYEYDNVYVYCPVYFVWMMAGDYAIKGVVDGYNPTHIEIWEVAKIEGTEDIKFFVSKSNADKGLYLRDRTQERKTEKRNRKNRIINSIFFVLSLIPTLLNVIKSGFNLGEAWIPAVAILALFAIKGIFSKKPVKVICTILIVIAILASALFLMTFSSSTVPAV